MLLQRHINEYIDGVEGLRYKNNSQHENFLKCPDHLIYSFKDVVICTIQQSTE